MDRWPTGAVLLLLLTVALLPLGLVLAWIARQNVSETDRVLIERADQQGLVAFQAIESLIARNALALRIAGNAALTSNPTDPAQQRPGHLPSPRRFPASFIFASRTAG